ncbi:MraY family glycosyltransferase [Pseudomonas indica]|uniref:Fuc2NAc and GlcNAc transferase n=1 Tax=Pseudomonas indica TaxID=137658 RepID=A0A1G8YST7_9PSED|nr:glycosyltransferase family 4 protein [Pseudomonas indica]SDK05868.1 Fuc2NAc and GlcNAc transferase [Pseudomonas indica]
MSAFWLLPVVAGLALLLTGVMRRYALSRSLMDIPNARSSHSQPTPRGGGVAIVVSFLAALPLLALHGLLPWPMLWAFLGAGGLAAGVGFLDDRSHVAPRWRLLAHFLAAFWLLAWVQGLPPLALLGRSLDLGGIGYVLAAFYLVWLLNLYNFMDGIDGIASMEAICVCLGGAVLYALIGQPLLALTPLLLVAAVAGFLYWNFPPARIFLGDSGSGFIGIVLGGLSLQAAWVDSRLLWGWLILLGVFLTDATLTLFRRLARGERILEAHRSHAYQVAARRYGAHLPVTLATGALTLCWLLPLAAWVALGDLDGLLGLALAYAPLGLLVMRETGVRT